VRHNVLSRRCYWQAGAACLVGSAGMRGIPAGNLLARGGCWATGGEGDGQELRAQYLVQAFENGCYFFRGGLAEFASQSLHGQGAYLADFHPGAFGETGAGNF